MEESFLKYRDNSAEDSDDLFDGDIENSPKSSTHQLISKNFNFTVDETTSDNDDNQQIESEVSQNENFSQNLSHKESLDTEDSEDDSFRKQHVKMRRRKPLISDDSDEDEHKSENKSSDLSQNSKSNESVNKSKLNESGSVGSLGSIETEEGNQSQKNSSEQTENQVTSISDKAEEETSSVEVLTNQLSATIILSSDDETNVRSKQDLNITPPTNASTPNKILVQPTINSILKKESSSSSSSAKHIICTEVEKAQQKQKVETIQISLRQVENILRTFNLSTLPDRGEKLNERMKMLTEELQQAEEKLNNMVVDKAQISAGPNMPSWKNLQVLSNQVLPAGFGGKKAMETLQAQKSLTMEKLKVLHRSLQTRPKEDAIVDDPKGLKVELMHHQRQALAFLLWRETQKPSGGILADDMGLGKTLTMISLILKSHELNLDVENNQECSDDSDEENKDENELKKKRNREYYPGGTLVVCPATLVEQWANEIKKHCRRDILDVALYHGANREMKSRRLAKHDVVITTYNLVGRERDCTDRLFGVRWKRIILDEAHIIRNYKSQSSIGVCALKAQHRWCLTGTPVHNKEIDLYALLKFLRCSPFDSLPIWRKWIDNKSAGGQERIDTIIQSIMLRRTKVNLQELGTFSLPSKHMDVINIKLNKEETKIYQKILIFSKTLFAQFLHQRAEKNVDLMYSKQNNVQFLNSNPNSEYEKIHKQLLKMNGGKTVKAHQILVLLLRLRQICCHPSLIRTMLENEACAADGIEDTDGNDIDLLEQIQNLNINEETTTPNEILEEESVDKLGTVASKVIDYKGEMFNPKSSSSKVQIVINTLKEKVINNGDKAIIVSQWTSMLEIVERHLKMENINCITLSGSVPVPKRMELVDLFNKSSSPVQVMLLSLTAGGVGLNLVGANHLLLIDLHWNPQLEAQAQDRIYRVGQKKPVIVYKFVTLDTIEERIKALQDNKLSMATSILTGSKLAGGNKLSMEDLKMLFNMT